MSDNEEMIELLRSAHAIALRKGHDVAWDRFANSIAKLGIGSVTPRTYRNAVFEREVRTGADGFDEKYGPVLRPFVALMTRELHANAHKGDRPGWLQMTPRVAIEEIHYHVAKLHYAMRHENHAEIEEFCADVANMALMLLDVCGGLAVEEK